MTHTHASGCGCGGSGTHPGIDPCGSSTERARYFPGKLITPEDLVAEQEYFLARTRRHNRLLHGWGVIGGAWVRTPEAAEAPSPINPQQPDPAVVIVEPGFVLGPWGHEILVEANVKVDVFAEDPDGNVVSCTGAADPSCAMVRPQRPADTPVYLAIRYAECPSRRMRAGDCGCGCGCDCSGECEYGRIRDSYVIKVLDELPVSYQRPRGHAYPDFVGVLACNDPAGNRQGRRPLPGCPDDPWVVLAELRLTGNSVTQIDPLPQRRFAAAFGDYYYEQD